MAQTIVGVVTGIIGALLIVAGHLLVAIIPFLYISAFSLGTLGLVYFFRIPKSIGFNNEILVMRLRYRKDPRVYKLADIKWVGAAELRGGKYSGGVKVKGVFCPFGLANGLAMRLREVYRNQYGNYPPQSPY